MRNRYLDLLRFLAVIRVVVYHVTGWASLTLVFPAMAVMFALAGSLMAASLDRSGPAALLRRLRRLLPSLWVVAVVLVPAMLMTGLPPGPKVLLWLFPIADPPANYWGALALSPIWYLRDYLWFLLASPVALWLFRRAPVATLALPYALLLVIELGLLPAAPVPLREFGVYFGAWLLGFAHHDGLLRRLANRVLLPTALALAGAGAAWIVTHPGPRGFDLNDIDLGNALWSAAFILVLLGRAPATARWIERSPLFSRAVTVLNRRALTVYLWHMSFVVLLTPLVDVVGWSHQDPVGLAIRVVLVFALVGVVTLLVGWVEDVAARRRPELVPGGRRAPRPAHTVEPTARALPPRQEPAGPVRPAPVAADPVAPVPVATRRGVPAVPVSPAPAGPRTSARPVRTLGVPAGPAGTAGRPAAGPGGKRRERSSVGAAGRAVVPAPRVAELATVEINAG
ncbi:Peptidoglycan/LPS O-acetylase OafA/YrhL, contains acyltransferase and SGNH-hydrolase domains [Micromonospora purpureochromogenes]|uniref:Peptidoglycan/LPS O-acetylase OafA/YrhL, contains acyltransferase and SGNH-hydrolase domains n=1 Tax=Micromonospora purpureochromogenes TaxID=47872 RepID=A0A1C4WL52_9ACTN|nr:acyltransferase [Micromonospora purpureochromogenes]SCE97016.1 Peptidoglycan/LPS O-acetylase OafA/YrhL, contains acyltransferase and SGNH-hydrolase domains [Micromonospora purpureochromogenes]